MNFKKSLLLLFSAAAVTSHAAVTMPKIFSDNMVLQADTAAMLRGKATPGARVDAKGSWGATASATADRNGVWKMNIRTPKASFEPLSLTVTDGKDGKGMTFNNVLAGEVWVASGQSNMEMPLRGFWNQPIEGGGDEITFSRRNGEGIRFITVPKTASYEPLDDVNAVWVESTPENAGEFSAVAWFFARSLRDILNVPVGILSCAYGGAKVEGYEPKALIANYPDRDIKAEQANKDMKDFERVGVMYYGMLYPLRGYTARGFLWNQGESNVGGHDYYPSRQADMLDHWRELWGNKAMPFYFVELPGWVYGGNDATECALFREAQHKAAATTPGAYMVSTVDIVYPDEPDDIHARNKRPIGQRLAQAAATYTYGQKGIPHEYPKYREMEAKGNTAVLRFDNMYSGWTPNDSENIRGFEVAGADKVFHPAKVRICPDLSLEVSSPEVSDIKAVRYCFKNFAIGNMHDTYGMPLMPFRTDAW